MKKYGIVTAMKEEADIIIEKYNLEPCESSQNVLFYESQEIVLVLCGIGKIQAAIGTAMLLEKYNPQTLVNIGIAGNAAPSKIEIGDVLLVNTVHQHDVYLPFSGEHLDYIKAPIIIKNSFVTEVADVSFSVLTNAICATGDQFIDDAKKVKSINDSLLADCVEMEAFSFLSTAREYGKLDACIVIKAISDGANNEAKDSHMTNLELAMNNSILVLDNLLTRGK